MALANLIVLNRKTPDGTSALLTDSCVLATCLREVRIAMQPAGAQPTADEADGAGYERHVGAEAYGFLLQLACGLESEIAGETEIFGQFKQAWHDYKISHPDQSRDLHPWMQRLLQDTKEIRSQYVVNMGSATYGSLVRRLLGPLTGPTLLIGAGQLAETVLPFLDTGEVLVWNRGRERAVTMMARQREAQTQGRVRLLDPTTAAEDAAWRRAHDVVICIPADAARDTERAALWRQHGAAGGHVLHLGINTAQGTAWVDSPGLATLQELFGLRDTQASQRELQLARARRACLNKAQLARLDDADGSRAGSSNHGWEDLAVFGAFSH